MASGQSPVGELVAYAWFAALRFRSSVQIGSSYIFPYPLESRYGNVRQRQRRCGTAVRTRIAETVTETDTDERKRNAGNQALVHDQS